MIAFRVRVKVRIANGNKMVKKCTPNEKLLTASKKTQYGCKEKPKHVCISIVLYLYLGGIVQYELKWHFDTRHPYMALT